MPPRAKTPPPPPVRRELLTLDQVLTEIGDGKGGPLAGGTFRDWRRAGKAPKVIKLPNGQVRVDRAELNRWLDAHTINPGEAA